VKVHNYGTKIFTASALARTAGQLTIYENGALLEGHCTSTSRAFDFPVIALKSLIIYNFHTNSKRKNTNENAYTLTHISI
jgi:hypothetical protein